MSNSGKTQMIDPPADALVFCGCCRKAKRRISFKAGLIKSHGRQNCNSCEERLRKWNLNSEKRKIQQYKQRSKSYINGHFRPEKFLGET